MLGFSPPRSRPPSHSGYGKIEERISLCLTAEMAQHLAHGAGFARSHDGAPSFYSRLLPKPQSASDRRTGPAAAARNVCPDATEAQAHAARSCLLGGTVPALALMERGPGHRQAGHSGPLASQGIPALLAMDLEARPRETAGVEGSTGAHSSFRPGERLGSTQGSRRT